jgi:hypothetical protein
VHREKRVEPSFEVAGREGAPVNGVLAHVSP